MRIDLNTRLPETYGASSRSKTGATTDRAAAGAGEDQAHFSPEHQRVQRLEAEAGNLSDVRRDKVEALRKAVAEGSYAPSAEQIAGSMMQEMIQIAR